MFSSLLLVVIAASVIFVIGANMYTSALGTQIAWEQKYLQQQADNVAYYMYEFKHSTSGTRKHIGEACRKLLISYQ
jgi:predicted transposase YbfD/YdcC